MPSYDYPFNERIRTLLRLEDLFLKVLHNLEGDHEFLHHNVLLSTFQILDIIERAELKMDLLQELDRQKMVMNHLRGNPSIEEQALDELIADIDNAAHPLRNIAGKLGQPLRDNEWLMSIKQRTVIPGGVCEFDLPSYHYWLGLSSERRKHDISIWISPLIPLYNAIRIILHILRGSGATSRMTAINGAYQQMLGGAKPAQMLRVETSDDTPCFPEVSANKYAINIRFNSLDNAQRPRPCDTDIDFSLTLCNL
ncbi:cell division protein ZapD [Methylobacillus rhizosphaerae]|uniref:Cell division protein ZapD n=1 Tax=Methylobacillus rhizosphaerae TaxID=551994 RepID=A0A238Y099_9PROT|nr:cell division protein ZapD [Methylobacillus rhizosphaerae]SNR64577.1 cell division protein ZapD [Methylobacillus rhizosphaerae]